MWKGRWWTFCLLPFCLLPTKEMCMNAFALACTCWIVCIMWLVLLNILFCAQKWIWLPYCLLNVKSSFSWHFIISFFPDSKLNSERKLLSFWHLLHGTTYRLNFKIQSIVPFNSFKAMGKSIESRLSLCRFFYDCCNLIVIVLVCFFMFKVAVDTFCKPANISCSMRLFGKQTHCSRLRRLVLYLVCCRSLF